MQEKKFEKAGIVTALPWEPAFHCISHMPQLQELSRKGTQSQAHAQSSPHVCTLQAIQILPVKKQVLSKAGGQGVRAQTPRRARAERHWNDWRAWRRELCEPTAELQHTRAICKATCKAGA